MKFGRNETRNVDDFARDLSTLVEEGRSLLAAVTDKPSKSTLRDAFEDVSDTLASIQTSATRAATRAAQEGARQGARYARAADTYVRDNPWPIVASGIALGVLATLWWNQRR